MITREQAKKNLISIGVADPTEEQITSYLNQIGSETQKEKDKADKYKEKADNYKAYGMQEARRMQYSV